MARFYAMSSPSFVFNLAARQVATAEGSSLSENARALALLNMASNDSLVASFWTKYHYNVWRPETAIHEGDLDGNRKTDADPSFTPYILTPCFPSYPSNHGSGSNSAAEVLRRVYGAGGHDITIANPAVPGLTFHYTRFSQITDDISDARVYGGIHYRFDQDAGADLGRDVATYVYKHNLRRAEDCDDDEGEERSRAPRQLAPSQLACRPFDLQLRHATALRPPPGRPAAAGTPRDVCADVGHPVSVAPGDPLPGILDARGVSRAPRSGPGGGAAGAVDVVRYVAGS